jgi:hypothetical protein
MMTKAPKTYLTTDLFKDRPLVPDFIKAHTFFKKPMKVQKVFPSIGMPNYQETASLDKCLTDVKKEGTYVFNVLKVMSDILNGAKDALQVQADHFQYLMSREEREKKRASMTEIYNLCTTVQELQASTDPLNKEVLDQAIQTEDGKIALRLIKDITAGGDKKTALRKGESLFRAFGKVAERCTNLGIPVSSIEQTDQFKIFGRENIPNKQFKITFSSDGPEGAWDILTMSMRGVKSCQRWNGEYPKCLIGSILSKFVGIIYLTSGVEAPPPEGYTQTFGSKMMRRCVVRYAIDADEERPCIIIDKMYPSGEAVDTDILKLFMDSIKARTSLPVYYAPDTANKLRHIYLPSEKTREEVLNREWSYQDTPLKSKNDLYVLLLNFNKDDIERELKGFRVNMSLYLARKFEQIYCGNIAVESEVKKTINNIRMNTSFTPVCDQIITYIMNAYRAPMSTEYSNSRTYYRKYLTEFCLQRKKMLAAYAGSIQTVVTQNTSRTFDSNAFAGFISSAVTEFAKDEIKRCIN